MPSNPAGGEPAGPASTAPSSSSAPTSALTKEDLRCFLERIGPKYPRYTDMLWDLDMTSLGELVRASKDTLHKAGVTNDLHKDNIIAAAGAASSSGQAGAGAETGPTPPGPSGLSEDNIRSVVSVVLKELKEPNRTRPFSSVGSTEALGVLRDLGLAEVEGSELAEIEVPVDIIPCSTFDYSRYKDENEGTPALLEHHQQQLAALGVKFGKHQFKMYDCHTQKTMFQFRSPRGQAYAGSVDGFVAPSGLLMSSACMEARIIYEHKQSEHQKASYQAGASSSSSLHALNAVAFTGRAKGQTLTALLASYAYNCYPLIFDLTDGEVHHLLQIKNSDVYVWEGLTPSQAYYKQATELLEKGLQRRNLTSVPEAEQLLEGAPNKRLRLALLGDSTGGLKEQLDSVVPFLPEHERLPATFEMISAWQKAAGPACPEPLSEAAQRMYA